MANEDEMRQRRQTKQAEIPDAPPPPTSPVPVCLPVSTMKNKTKPDSAHFLSLAHHFRTIEQEVTPPSRCSPRQSKGTNFNLFRSRLAYKILSFPHFISFSIQLHLPLSSLLTSFTPTQPNPTSQPTTMLFPSFLTVLSLGALATQASPIAVSADVVVDADTTLGFVNDAVANVIATAIDAISAVNVNVAADANAAAGAGVNKRQVPAQAQQVLNTVLGLQSTVVRPQSSSRLHLPLPLAIRASPPPVADRAPHSQPP